MVFNFSISHSSSARALRGARIKIIKSKKYNRTVKKSLMCIRTAMLLTLKQEIDK